MPAREEIINSLNGFFEDFVVSSGEGIEDFNLGDETLAVHIMRFYDWDPRTNEENGCFRIQVTFVSTKNLSLQGVSLFVFDVKEDKLLRSGDLQRSKDRSAEHWVMINQLPFGSKIRLQLRDLTEDEGE